MGSLRISAVVPCLEEADRIGPLLESLESAGIEERIVVDAGSSDATRERAAPLADQVIEERGGLARQLNRGAALARGSAIFFVYADCALPATARLAIEGALADPACVGGAFRLRLEGDRAIHRVISWGANLRTQVGLGPFGDQGIFVRREVFREIGGYRERPLLEDLDLVRRLRRQGMVRVLPGPMVTSARRWQRNGVISTALRNWWFLARHLTGASSDSEARRRYATWRTGGR